MPNLRQLFLQHVAQTSDFPLSLEIERAEGIWLYSPDGKKFADLISGIGVSSIGHCHPKVVKAVQDQAAKFMHLMVYGEYVHAPQVKLAEKLCQKLPKTLDSVYFVNSGTEATEGAMKLAKRHTGRQEIIACRNAYHGSTQGALSLMDGSNYTEAFLPLLPQVKFIDFNHLPDLTQINEKTAAVIIETIQGEAGVRIPSIQYLQKLRMRCSETGTLLILDEIQTGFGRTGKMFAFEHFDIVPDVLLLAKAMGGGMPIGAFIAPKNIMQSLSHDPILGHITTFGGHAVNCAAALANLEVLETIDLNEVETKALRIKNQLQHPLVKEIRHKGLMMAIEMPSFDVLKKVIDLAIEEGVITDWFLHCDNSMRIAPPLTISIDEIDACCKIIWEAMEDVHTLK